MATRPPLLMIPGPIEVSPSVLERFSAPPPGHLAPSLIDSFGASLEMMRRVWLADPSAQPFVIAGGGTVGMEMAAANLVLPGDRVLLVNTGWFSDRAGEMARRLGAEVVELGSEPGNAPSEDEIRRALADGSFRTLFATHVDTSTGVRIDPQPIAALAREHGVLSVFDGVCATAGERFEMAAWNADVYLTASQKAIGLPPGLALMVVSAEAMERRRARAGAPPAMYLDWLEWQPVMRAYEERRPAYFSTPATNLIAALERGLEEILCPEVDERVALHARAASALRAAWRGLGLDEVPLSAQLAANTLSALCYPEGVDASLVGRIRDHGVVVAPGLHPAIRERYFRVGHMGYAVQCAEMLERTVEAVGRALVDAGVPVDPPAAVDALRAGLEESGSRA